MRTKYYSYKRNQNNKRKYTNKTEGKVLIRIKKKINETIDLNKEDEEEEEQVIYRWVPKKKKKPTFTLPFQQCEKCSRMIMGIQKRCPCGNNLEEEQEIPLNNKK